MISLSFGVLPDVMTEAQIITLFRRSKALLEGHFQLSSGRHSNRYFQCALILQDPAVATRLGAALGKLFAKESDISAVVAPALGGILVAHEVARALKARALFTERVNGIMMLRRGFSLTAASPVIVVEDVITTGLSTRETMEAVQKEGGVIKALGALVDRSGGEVGKHFNIPVRSLLAMPVESYDPNDCPWCRKQIPLVKPGSRA